MGEAKDALREAVQLPLQHPALFKKGNLLRPQLGVLLFGACTAASRCRKELIQPFEINLHPTSGLRCTSPGASPQTQTLMETIAKTVWGP